jgi:GNAT superfamily N-acetyltransferase
MVLDLDRVPDELARDRENDIRRIVTPSDLALVQRITREVWNDEMTDLFGELAWTLSHEPDRLSVYAAWREGEPASAAWIRMPAESRFASLWGGSTLERHRGRGLYTALLATRVREAAGHGFRFVTVDAGPMSKPIVERFGFVELTTARDYTLAAPTSSR